MKGSFKKDDTQDTVETLRVKVAELEKRRQKIQSEIDVYYRNCKTKLDLEYKELIDKHYKEYNEKIAELNKRETIIENGEIALSVQKDKLKTDLQSAIDTAEKKNIELESLITENKKKIEDIETKYIAKQDALNKQMADIVSEREGIKKTEKILKDAHSNIDVLQKQNQEKSIRLDNLIRDYEGKVNYIDFQKTELKEQVKGLDSKELIMREQELDIKHRISNAKEIENKAKVILDTANQISEENKKESTKLKAESDTLNTLSVSLSELRNTLTEKELSNNEKDRYLILKERTVDGKIRILNELRKK